MKSNKPYVLTINGGSSGIKFALYELSSELPRVFHGEIERIGTHLAKLNFSVASVTKNVGVLKRVSKEGKTFYRFNKANLIAQCIKKLLTV